MPRRPNGCMTAPSFGHFRVVCVSSVMTRSSSGAALTASITPCAVETDPTRAA